MTNQQQSVSFTRFLVFSFVAFFYPRGSPYTSMVYSEATPRFYVQRSISHDLIIDNNEYGPRLVCGNGYNVFSETPILVKREIKVQFEVSDMTWIIFISEPTYFICSNLYFSTSNPPGTGKEHQEPHFDLRAVNPMFKGMVRIAMVNNCTTGKHHAQCTFNFLNHLYSIRTQSYIDLRYIFTYYLIRLLYQRINSM